MRFFLLCGAIPLAGAFFCVQVASQSWGDTVTSSVVLTGDLVYDGIHPVGLTVAASDVTVDLAGFTLDGLGAAAAGIYVQPGVDNVTIRGGTVRGCQRQVHIEADPVTRSGGHQVLECDLAGGFLGGPAGALNRGNGVYVAYADDVRIEDCTIHEHEGSGIDCYGGRRLVVEDCRIRNVGMGTAGGGAAGVGVSCLGPDPRVRANSFDSCGGSAILMQGRVPGSQDSGMGIVSGNRIRRLPQRPLAGRDLGAITVAEGWRTLIIAGNTILRYDASLGGSFAAPYAIGLGEVEDIRILENTIRGLPGTGGIRLVHAAARAVELRGNTIAGNGAFGLRTEVSPASPIAATFNWWGDPSGPSGSGPGGGDAIIESAPGDVRFDPWYLVAGIFHLAQVLPAGPGPRQVAAGDLNGDNRPDLVVVNEDPAGLRVFCSTPAGFVERGFFPSGGRGAAAVALGRLDGDTFPDAAVAEAWSDTFSILLGSGDGGFSLAALLPAAHRPTAVATGDLDGDGWNDLALAQSGSPFRHGEVTLLRNDGAGGFPGPATVLALGGAWQDVLLGDLNGDLVLDVVAVDSGSIHASTPGGVTTWRNLGGWSFTPQGHDAGEVPFDADLYDLDADHALDLLVADLGDVQNAGQVAWLPGDGLGGFGPATFYDAGLVAPRRVHGADLASDGDGDLVVADVGSGRTSLLLDHPSGFTVPHTLAAGTIAVDHVVADLDGDGLPDIASIHEGSDDLMVHLGVVRPTARRFGTGCAGGSGRIPVLSYEGETYLGNPSFLVAVSQARPAAVAHFMIGTEESQKALGGCTLYVGNRVRVLSTVTDASGYAAIQGTVKESISFLGRDFYGQWAVEDPGPGGANGRWALSDGLQVRIGL